MKKAKSINEFKSLVRTLAETKKNNRQTNSGPHQARIVISELLNHAKSSVVIYTNDFDSDLYDSSEVTYSMLRFLKKDGTSLNVKHSKNANPEESFLLKLIMQDYPSKVKVVETDRKVQVNNADVNFIVGDENAYRLENDAVNHTAIFDFGNLQMVKNIKKAFSEL